VDGAFDKADKARADAVSKKTDAPALVDSKKAKKFSFTRLVFPYPQLITAFQISQMVVGVTVVVACFYFHFYGEKGKYKYKDGPKSCGNTESNLLAGGIMYGSYLYLFCEFAIKKFIFGIDDSDKLRGKPSSNAKVSGFSSNSSSSKVITDSSKASSSSSSKGHVTPGLLALAAQANLESVQASLDAAQAVAAALTPEHGQAYTLTQTAVAAAQAALTAAQATLAAVKQEAEVASSPSESKSNNVPTSSIEGLISPDKSSSAPSPNPKQRASLSKTNQ